MRWKDHEVSVTAEIVLKKSNKLEEIDHLDWIGAYPSTMFTAPAICWNLSLD